MKIMKSYIKTFLTMFVGFGMVSCSQESPFDVDVTEGAGRFLSSSLSVEVRPEGQNTKAAVPDVSDFTIDFFDTSNPSEPFVSYVYGDMPDIVTLPAGTYKVGASFGGEYGTSGEKAAFDTPYYYGSSEEFKVEANKIVDRIETIVCKLSNVRVSIKFDDDLLAVMSSDSKVSVKVGESGALDFTPQTTSDGYFAYDEGSNTLAATFDGEVEGYPTNETKTYNDVKPGNYYKITFRLHSIEIEEPNPPTPPDAPTDPDEEKEGNITSDGSQGIRVDATLTTNDLTGENGIDISPDVEEYLEDDLRPGGSGNNPGGETPPENPGEDDDPVVPDNPSKTPPSIIGVGVDLNTVNEVVDGMICQLDIVSRTTITGFKVKISSDNSNFIASLEDLLGTEIDLLQESDLSESLKGLGFPVGDEITNPTDKDENGYGKVNFRISDDLMTLLKAFDGIHTFTLIVSNSDGTTTASLKLQVK